LRFAHCAHCIGWRTPKQSHCPARGLARMLRQEQAEAQPEIERGRRQSAGRERESDGGRGRESEREGAQQAHGFCLPREISK